MKNKVFVSFFILIVFVSHNARTQNSTPNLESKTQCSSFRYVIVNNEIDPKLDSKDENRRFVEILLDKQCFSKITLTKLFKFVSSRFPKPKTLFIDVYTDLKDIQTPEERDEGKTSESQENNLMPSYFATFTRYKNKMEFLMYADYYDDDVEEVEIK